MITRQLRRPEAAGTFYPADPAGLIATVDRLLAAVEPDGVAAASLGLIVPHAGYRYSGPVAASAYAHLPAHDGGPARVAILGPAHFVPLLGATVPSADAWLTPIGEVTIDPGLREAAVAAGASVSDHPHAREHALEVQLPFLQRRLGDDVRVLPVAVGASEPEGVATLIEALAPAALIVVSTDLSHYRDQETARRLDRRTADAVLAADPEAIGPEDACGAFALRGAAAWVSRAGLSVRLLGLRTSADTAGDPSRVVGYGAFAIAGAD